MAPAADVASTPAAHTPSTVTLPLTQPLPTPAAASPVTIMNRPIARLTPSNRARTIQTSANYAQLRRQILHQPRQSMAVASFALLLLGQSREVEGRGECRAHSMANALLKRRLQAACRMRMQSRRLHHKTRPPSSRHSRLNGSKASASLRTITSIVSRSSPS